MISPGRSHFTDQAGNGKLMPLRVRISADLETPVSLYLKLKSHGAVFLLESVERGVQMGRYSFVGLAPRVSFRLQGEQVTIQHYSGPETGTATLAVDPLDPLALVRTELENRRLSLGEEDDLPPPFGGAVGYLGYDMVRYFDAVELPNQAAHDLPDFHFLFPRTMAVFDHVKSEIEILVIPPEGEPDDAYARAEEEISTLLKALQEPLPARLIRAANNPTFQVPADEDEKLESNLTRDEYTGIVDRAKEHILAGDAFQIVLSQRLSGRTHEDPFQVYRALRILNPSPYLFFLDFDDYQLIGSSPEMLVRLDQGRLQVNPIAGTRPRGETAAEDAQLAEDLLADEKERAEHVMLVDLGRNDLGRVCDTGSITVDDFMSVERYSHVMHLVTRVSGDLREGIDMFAALRAVFPAGTVSGAPKIRAMQIVSDLEPDRRGPYAGAVGYFGQRGDMDMCITIRTLLMRGGTFSVQAGAGIVADSVPENEYEETLAKIRALTRAVRIAEEGL